MSKRRRQSLSLLPLSLGDALFGGPRASGYARAGQRCPDAWLLHFAKRAGNEVLLGLFRTCKAGRDVVLSTAPSFEVRLRCDPQSPTPTQWLKQLTTIRQALRTRGTLPTTITLQSGHKNDFEVPGDWYGAYGQNPVGDDDDYIGSHDRGPNNGAEYALILSSLCGAGDGVNELCLIAEGKACHSRPHARVIADFLRAASAAFPNLTTLGTRELPCAMPPPSHLPKLTHLRIGLPDHRALAGRDLVSMEDLCKSIAAYLPRLQSLRLWQAQRDEEDNDRWDRDNGAHRADDWPAIPWPTLFTAGTALTSFSCDRDLTGELAGLLVKHAPGLVSLGVWRVRLAEDMRQSTWGVTSLCVEHVDEDHTLQYLPTNPAGVVVITGPPHMQWKFTEPEGLDPVLVQRLPEWSFKDTCIVLHPPTIAGSSAAQALAHAPVLRTLLSQLQHLQAPDVLLAGWEWSAAAVDAMADMGPACAHLRLAVSINKPLTDALLSELWQLHVHSLSVTELKLKTAQHVRAQLPWQVLTVHHGFDMTQLAMLPYPSSDTLRVQVSCVRLHDKMDKESLTKLQGVLQHIRWAPASSGGVLCFELYSHRETSARALRSQLELLRRVQLASARTPAYVNLFGWHIAEPVLQALRWLPAWPCLLGFTHCMWPLSQDEPWPKRWQPQLAEHPLAVSRGWVPGFSHRYCHEEIIAVKGVRERKEEQGEPPAMRPLLSFESDSEEETEDEDFDRYDEEPVSVVLHRPDNEVVEVRGVWTVHY